MNKICETCGIEFSKTNSCSRKEWDKRKFCSHKCADFNNRNFIEDVWKYINKKSEDECWEWMGGFDGKGYGRIYFEHKRRGAHRVVYELTYGKIQNELYVCHKCNNPICCNPKHLYLGTQKDNLKQMIEDGRSHVGEKHGLAKLTEEDVLKIRKMYSTGKYTLKTLGETFKTCFQNISDIINRKHWRHI